MSYSKQESPPPPYDQLTTIDIDSGTAPLLGDTFSGSIFATSTVVTFEFASGSYPTREECNGLVTKTQDYTFVIRDFLGCVQANGKVSNVKEDLDTVLQDVRGNEILRFRKQYFDSIDTTASPPSFTNRFATKIFQIEQPNTVHTFEVTKNGTRIGLVAYGDKEPIESCLRIYVGDGATGFTVRSLTRGEFVIFRDQSSDVPLCNINMEPYEFKGKIVFHPETGITTEEQLLCTASAFAYNAIWTKLRIAQSEDFGFRMGFWMLFTLISIVLICWLGMTFGPDLI